MSRLIDHFGIAPPGVSGAYCRSCNHYLTFPELVELTRKDNTCTACNATIHVDQIGVSFQYETVKLAENSDAVFEQTWFHATQKETWASTVLDDGVVAHVGSRRSAIQRAIDLSRRLNRVDKDWVVHEIKVPQTASVSWGVEYDIDDDAVKTVEELKNNHNSDIVRYLNMYEDCGSISLITNPNIIRIISSEFISADALMDEYLQEV
jgi:hypothetical protein